MPVAPACSPILLSFGVACPSWSSGLWLYNCIGLATTFTLSIRLLCISRSLLANSPALKLPLFRQWKTSASALDKNAILWSFVPYAIILNLNSLRICAPVTTRKTISFLTTAEVQWGTIMMAVMAMDVSSIWKLTEFLRMRRTLLALTKSLPTADLRLHHWVLYLNLYFFRKIWAINQINALLTTSPSSDSTQH